MAATLEEVARLAGVSTMTVSRALNNPEKVKKNTLERIKETIKACGYYPNVLARNLAKGESKTIGLISSNIFNQAYISIIASIENVAETLGYTIIKINVNRLETAINSFNNMVGNQVDGIILMPLEMEMNKATDYKTALKDTYEFVNYFLDICQKRKINVITISQKIEGIANVEFDYKEQGKKSVEYLVKKGYKDIAMINSVLPEGLWKEKEDVYKDVMERNGLSKYIKIERDIALFDGGKKATERILRERVPKALYCANDYMAAGAIHAISERGLAVGKDIAVMGNDDMYLCEYVYPKLSTVAIGTGKAGELAVKKLLKLIMGEPQKDEVITPTLIERAST